MTYPLERVQRFPVKVPQPAVGADWVLTPTGLGAWRILSFTALLTTSAAVGNRTVALAADDQTVTYFRVPAVAAQAATLAIHYSGFDGSSTSPVIGADQEIDWPHGGLVLYQGHNLRSVTAGIDVGDQWSSIVALVEEYPSGGRFLTTPVGMYQVEEW